MPIPTDAAAKLVQAAALLAQRPEAMQLRYLQTLTGIAGEKSNTIIFPLPIDLMSAFTDMVKKAKG